jgi:phosphoribosylformylglycinamidine synthase II
MASAEFGEETDSKLPTVQVGDPFMEKLLLEACLEIFATDCLSGVQDMGAAGLTSSSVEMADRAGNGIELDLDAIPRRTKALSPYEMLLSESQERMLMVAKEGREQEVFDICAKWDLDASIVGRVTDTGRFVCKATPGYDPFDGTGEPDPVVVVDLPVDLLTNAAPKYDRPQKSRAEQATIVTMTGDAPDDLGAELLDLIGSPNIGSRSWIWRQYDHIVRDGTVIRPGMGDAAVVRVFCEDETGMREKYLAVSCDCNGRHVEIDPFGGAAMAVAECTRNIVCVGGKPLGLTDCLNFGNPEMPEQMWRFAQAIDGLAAACTALGAPVVSGNVSLYNETDGRAILPTPTVAVVGQLEEPEHRLELGFRREGDVIAHLGRPSRGVLGGSEWLVQHTGSVTGAPVGIDLEAEAALQHAVLQMARAKLLHSAHDISDGGFAVCIAEACIANGFGARVSLPADEDAPAHALLFSEEPSRIIVSLPASKLGAVGEICARHGVPFEKIGAVAGDTLLIEGACDVPVEELAEQHARALDSIVN